MTKRDDTLVNSLFQEQIQYLADRGIDQKLTTKLKLEFVTHVALQELGYELKNVEKGILWRIRDISGEETGAVGARIFYKKSFGVQYEGPKFAPPKKQKPRLYFPPIINWSKLKKNSKLVLCESFLKADLLASLGFPAIGVSGVWGWSVDRCLNDDFRTIPFQSLNLQFVVSFDSNVGEGRKDELNLAVARLSTEMFRLGVTTHMSQLPPPDEGDWGIDDYYVAHGANAVKALFNDDKLVEVEGDLNQHLRIMNREVAYVANVDRVVRLHEPDFNPMTTTTFKTGAFANRIHWTLDANGKIKKFKLANEWLDWSERNELYDIVYAPGEPRIVTEMLGKKEIRRFNVWQGMGCEPEHNDEWEQLWTEWLEMAFPDEAERHWFCSWWACQVQEPGIKMNTALVMLGESGVGKGWVANIMRRIFGHANTAAISLAELNSSFNSGYSQKQLVLVEEAEMPSRAEALYGKLKDLITNERLHVNMKGVPTYEIGNHVNLCLQSNNVDVLRLDSFDRRFAVFDIVNDKLAKGGDTFWALRWEALRIGLPEAVHEWLQDYDTTDFDPFGTAPASRAKDVMYESGLTGRELFVETLKREPDAVLDDEAALYTAQQLEFIYQGTGEDVNMNQARAMGKTLAHARFDQYRNAEGEVSVMRGHDNKCGRYWVIRPLDEKKFEEDPRSCMSKIGIVHLK